MFPSVMSNSTSLSEEASIVSSVTRVHDFSSLNPMFSNFSSQQPNKIKKKRNLPGNPDPDAEVIALSPKSLMATNRFVCEICNKGFQRDQNLQLHRRGHNLPWKLKQRNSKDIIRKRVYVCPESSCVHHHPSRALGDLTGIKKHFCRKHGEKKWKCEKCSKIYAVQSDWKAHSKTCGTREYRCDCGTLFSRKDSFVTHRAFCDALAEESARLSSCSNPNFSTLNPSSPPLYPFSSPQLFTPLHWDPTQNPNPNSTQNPLHIINKPQTIHHPINKNNFINSPFHVSSYPATSAHLSATALLQKAGSFGAQPVGHVPCTMTRLDMGRLGHVTTIGSIASWQQKSDRLTRDFLGLTAEEGSSGRRGGNVDVSVRNLLSYTGGVEFSSAYEHHHHHHHHHQAYGFAEPAVSETWGNC
ncbi:hypothetical protein LguiA_011536 [Lonicera macranthoides]